MRELCRILRSIDVDTVVMAVSYTHLDVYKRQIRGVANRKLHAKFFHIGALKMAFDEHIIERRVVRSCK